MTDEFSAPVISRRTFLFTLAAVTCMGFAPEVQAANNFSPFSFGYVTDAHLTHGKPDSYLLLQQSQLFLQDCVKQLNDEKLDFVIFGGDQVETPGTDDTNWQLFVDVAQILSCPWSFVLGEKDVSGIPPVDKMKLYGPDWRAKGIQADKPYWSQSPLPGVHIVGLDTSRAESTTGDISNEQLDWLKKDLASNSGKFTIVFSHHPLLAPPPFDAGPPWDDYTVPQGASAREILGASKDVHLAISGHLHVNKVQQEQAIWYVSSASLDVYPCVYKIFRVSPQGMQIETWQISFPALVKKARQMLDSSAMAFKYNEQKPQAFADLAFGTRIDNNALLPMVAGQPAQFIDEKKLRQAKEKKKSEQPQPTKQEPEKNEKKAKNDKKAKNEKEKAKEKGKESKDTDKHKEDKHKESEDHKDSDEHKESDEHKKSDEHKESDERKDSKEQPSSKSNDNEMRDPSDAEKKETPSESNVVPDSE